MRGTNVRQLCRIYPLTTILHDLMVTSRMINALASSRDKVGPDPARWAEGENVQPDASAGQRAGPGPHQGGGTRQGADGQVSLPYLLSVQCCGSGSGIQDEQPTRIIFPLSLEISFLGLKYLNSLMRWPGIRDGKNSDPGWKKSDSGKTSRIRNFVSVITF